MPNQGILDYHPQSDVGVFCRYPQQQENSWIIVIIVLCEEDKKSTRRKKNILENISM